jgi:hypothetical protein
MPMPIAWVTGESEPEKIAHPPPMGSEAVAQVRPLAAWADSRRRASARSVDMAGDFILVWC